MAGSRKDLGKRSFRKELSAKFVEAARKKNINYAPKGNLLKLLSITEAVRSEIIIPASKKLDSIKIERKDVGDGRVADAKTFSIKTDNECESLVEASLKKLFPEALVVGEEMFGEASLKEKLEILKKVETTDKEIFLVDALDGTRDFRSGGDGHSVIIVMVRNGEVLASVVHRNIDYSDIDGLGQTITFEKGDCVRINGKALKNLSQRSFARDSKKLRGYACIGFLNGEFSKSKNSVNLKDSFDSLSDLWTCSKMYCDIIKGEHHFMLVEPPVDLFDYSSGITLIKEAGGVARFIDGSDATVEEIIKRQTYGSKNKAQLKDSLILAVSEEVFLSVQKEVLGGVKFKKQKNLKLKK